MAITAPLEDDDLKSSTLRRCDPSPKVSVLRSFTIIRLTLMLMMIPLFTSKQPASAYPETRIGFGCAVFQYHVLRLLTQKKNSKLVGGEWLKNKAKKESRTKEVNGHHNDNVGDKAGRDSRAARDPGGSTRWGYGEMEMLLNSTEAASDVAIAADAADASRESLEIATAAVRQAEARSEGLQMELHRTLRELDDAKAERISDKRQIADLQKDVKRQQEQQQQQQQVKVVMRSEDKEVKLVGDKIEALQQNDQFANVRGEEMGQNNVTSLPKELIHELEILEDGIKAELAEGEQLSLDLLTEVDNIVLQDSSVAAELNEISSEIQMQISPVPPKEKRLSRLARRIKSIWKK
eukprot:scaffold352_cov203-Chaetoceros_neogracile.AAC.12